MADQQSWVEALNVSPEELNDWSAQAPTGMPLLAWCLEQGHISVERYLAWASEAFGLPVLNSKFFSEAFDSTTVRSLRNTWSPWCFPIGVWDDITFVACVEPPPEPESNHRYILADPTVMSEAWGHSDVGIEMPPPTPPALPTPEAEDDFMKEAPVGVTTAKTMKFKLQLAGDDSPPDVPEVDEPSINTGSIIVDELSDKSSPRIEFDLQTAGLSDPDDKTPMPPPAPPAKGNVAPLRISIPVPSTNSSGMVDGSQITATSVISTAVEKQLPTEAEILKELEQAYLQIRKDYIGTVILQCEDSRAFLKKWDPSIEIDAKATTAPIALDTPSLFRIVFKTRLPYHGFAVDSPAHKEMFTHLGLKDVPACVSAIPFIYNNNLVGMLVAFGNEAAQNPKILEKLQKITDHLTGQLGTQWLRAG